jgi:hypothetical protein
VLYQVTGLGYSEEAMGAYVQGIAESIYRSAIASHQPGQYVMEGLKVLTIVSVLISSHISQCLPRSHKGRNISLGRIAF